ncbi:hypothetical protein BH10BAC5_BH10BAC5_01150 [soil metagenome]
MGKKSINLLIFVILIAINLCLEVTISNAQWIQATGVNGGTTKALTILGSKIFALVDRSDVYMSSNNGLSWIDVTHDLPPVESFCISTVGNSIVVGLSTSGIFTTTNEGNNWVSGNNGLSNINIRNLTVFENKLYTTIAKTIYVSSDGINWNIFGNLLPYYINKIDFTKNRIIAGTIRGIYLSEDLGTTWNSAGFNNYSIKYLNSDSDRVVATAQDNNNIFAGKLLLSTNSGLNWTTILEPAKFIKTCLIKNNFVFTVTYNGFFRSTNTGVSWDSAYINFDDYMYNEDNLIAAGHYGIFSSSNNGLSWELSNSGISRHHVFCIEKFNNSYFAYTTKLHKSTNFGVNWFEFDSNLDDKFIISIKSMGNILFAASYGLGIYKSLDSGSTWSLCNSGLTNLYISCIIIDGNILYVGTNNGVFYSTNQGDSWNYTNNYVTVNCLNVQNSLILAGTPNGTYISTNNGLSWSVNNIGLTNQYIYSVTESNNNIFVGTDNGVFISTNTGQSWAATSYLGGVANLRVYTLNSINNVVIAGTGSGIYTTTNNGIHWAAKNEGFHYQNLNTNTLVNTLYLNENFMLAGISDNSIWRRTTNEITDVTTEPVQLINNFSLSQNYPNPFNPLTNIKFSLLKNSFVNLKVIDITGKQVAELVNENLQAGSFNYSFDGTGLTSGVYFYKLSAGNFSEVKKMVLMK